MILIIAFFFYSIDRGIIKLPLMRYLFIFIAAAIITDFAINMFSIGVSWTDVHNTIFTQYYGESFNKIFGISNRTAIFEYSPNAELEEVIRWMKNFSTESRFVFEFSYAERKFNGYISFILPYWTGKRVISSFEVYDGIFYQRRIADYTSSEFVYALSLMNVKYLIVWSSDFKQFLAENNQTFSKIFQSKGNLLEVYENKNASNSYIDYDKNKISAKLETMGVNYVKIIVTNGKVGEKINLKIKYNPHWVETSGDDRAKVIEGEKFKRLRLNKEGNYVIELKYANTPFDQIMQTLPLAIFATVLLILWMFRNKMKTMKI